MFTTQFNQVEQQDSSKPLKKHFPNNPFKVVTVIFP